MGKAAFEKAVDIYNSGGVVNFEDAGSGFSAKIRGSKGNFYNVYISARNCDSGNCDCYMGKNDYLCKHMIALAIRAVSGDKKISEDEKSIVETPRFSGRLGNLQKSELLEMKANITSAMRCIKPYNGPSRIWFSYQSSLSEGCGRLAEIVSELPAGEQTAKLLIDVLLRLDKKLCSGGVDDSEGTVGGFIEQTVGILEKFAELDPACIEIFKKLSGRETCFGWEEPLLKFIEN